MAGYKENKQFSEAMFPNPLDDAVDWINSNMEPEDVFSEDQLAQWATNSGYVKEGD